MSLRLRTLNETPPGGHRFFIADVKQWVPATGYHHAYADLRDDVSKCYQANRIPVPANLDEMIQDQECKSLPGRWCIDADGRSWDSGATGTLTLATVRQGTATLLDWYVHGGRKEQREEVERRSAICAMCHFNRVPADCATCGNGGTILMDMVNKIVAGEPYATDSQLNACYICSCQLRAKVRIPLDILKRHLTPEQTQRLPSHCWLA